MATQRALITTREDFGAPTTQGGELGYPGKEFNPYVFYNGEELPTGLVPTNSATNTDRIEYGTEIPDYVPGARGIAQRFSGRFNDYMRFANWYLPPAMDTDKWMVSLYFTPSDVSQVWQGIATTRGDGYPSTNERGFHIAMRYNYLNVRGLSSTPIDLYTNAGTVSGTPFYLEVGQTYHIVVSVDPSKTNKFEVYINGELILASTTWIRPGYNERSITIGNFLSAPGTTHYPAYGDIDEFLFFVGNATTPTIAEIKEYDNYVRTLLAQGRLLDYDTDPGSVMLYQKSDGTYYTGGAIGWESGVIDIGDPPIAFSARLHMIATMDPNAHTIALSTQVSDDGINFDTWQAVGSDGTVYSAKKRYYKFRASLSTTDNLSTPVLHEIQLLEYVQAIKYALTSEPLRVYADLDTGLKPMGILNNAYEIWIEEEVKGMDVLTFKLPMNDPKRISLGNEAVEYLVRIGNRRYILKENKDQKGSSGKKISDFKGEAKWYELNDPKIEDYELIEADVSAHVTKVLAEANPAVTWRLNANVSSVTKKRTIRGKWKSVLALLRDIEATFGVELEFYYDEASGDDLIDIKDNIGEDNKIRFYYDKNIKEIERIIDTYGMVTRLYVYGAGELDIRTVNGGLPYIDNMEWVNKLKLRNKIRIDQWTDDRYTIPENLLEDGNLMLDQLSKPNITYAMSLLDLSSRSGHEPESINLGDTAYAVDRDLMIDELPSRVMRRKYNVREPYKTEVELDQPKKQLADAKSRAFADDIQNLTESDPLSNEDIQEMTVFNHLLNSRADDGLAEWIQGAGGGIEASADGGFSGENSFKIVANYGEFKTLSQSVYNVSHRSTYTISAMVYKEGEITPGTNGFMGIRVKVRYRPDAEGNVKEETKLLKIPDVTDQ